jgi:H+/Cl- antiporter ClcA
MFLASCSDLWNSGVATVSYLSGYLSRIIQSQQTPYYVIVFPVSLGILALVWLVYAADKFVWRS